MPNVSITERDLARFITAPANERLEIVRDMRERGGYDRRRDFYGPVRDAIQQVHRSGDPVADLSAIAKGQKDPRKQKNYPGITGPYVTEWEELNGSFFGTDPAAIVNDDITVRSRAEIGVETGGRRYLTKLWFNTTKPSSEMVDILQGTILLAAQDGEQASCGAAVWDIRNKRFDRMEQIESWVRPTITSEIANFRSYWNSLDE
ncbi:MAG: hypothetical protein HQ478_12710 [Chloroflexi bacterium]|nr:hypothetical protein [Chloroflexota bacterium]